MKKIFLVLFSLIMMCSVSFGIESNVDYKSSSYNSPVTSSIQNIGNFSPANVYDILVNYGNDTTNEEYVNSMNLLVEELENQNLRYVIFYSSSYNRYYLLVANSNYDVEFVANGNTICFFETSSDINNKVVGYLYGYARREAYYYYIKDSETKISSLSSSYNRGFSEIYKSSSSIPSLTKSSLSSCYYWDGSTYSYEVPEQGGSSEINLTDEQIAEIVERFINSNAYLEKAYYNGDYFITYDNLTGYFRGYSYAWNIDLAIEYGNYNDEGEFITTGTKEGEAWRIRPYEFSGDIFNKFGDWLASKFNTYTFEYFSISPDSTIEPRYVGSLEHNYCSNYKENEVVIYSSKQIRYVGEETNSEGKTETVVTDNYIPPTILKDSVTGEEIIIRDNLQSSSDSLENVITPNADFSGLKQAFEKYISFIDISSITWLATAISSMITIFVPFVALGIIIFLINRILNGGS